MEYHKIRILGSFLLIILFASCNSQFTYVYKVNDIQNDCYYQSYANYFSIIKNKKGHLLVIRDSNLINSPFVIYKFNNSDLYYKLPLKSTVYSTEELVYSLKDTITTIDVFEENKIPLTSNIKRWFLKDSLIQINETTFNTMIFKSCAGKPTLFSHYQTEMIDYIDKNILLPVKRDYYFYNNSGELKTDKCFSIYLIKIIKQ